MTSDKTRLSVLLLTGSQKSGLARMARYVTAATLPGVDVLPRHESCPGGHMPQRRTREIAAYLQQSTYDLLCCRHPHAPRTRSFTPAEYRAYHEGYVFALCVALRTAQAASDRWHAHDRTRRHDSRELHARSHAS